MKSAKIVNISVASDLRRLRVDKTAHYRLTRDIDMGGRIINPAGNGKSPFTGILDGNGFKIYNFTMPYPSSDGNLGLLSLNQGVIRNLHLADFTVIVEEGTEIAGTIAAKNQGTISGCRVSGTLVCEKNIPCGGLVGVNSGVVENCCVQLTMSGKADFGGLVGVMDGGILEDSDMAGTIHTEEETAGLLVGTMHRGQVAGCCFSGEKSTPAALVGTENGGICRDCLTRDHSRCDGDLTPGQYALRKEAVEHMYRMATTPWTPDAELNWKTAYGHETVTQRYEAGKTYYGMPYTNKNGSLERFDACFNPDGTLKDFIKAMPTGYDGFDLYMGNDCSGGIYWSWCRVGCSFSFDFTKTAMPWAGCGTLPVGEYTFEPEMETDQIRDLNGQQKMAEAWAKLYFGDAILQRTTAKGGHIRLVSQSPVVYRSQDGTIDLDNSYILTHEQGGNLGANRNMGGWSSTWLTNHRYTFRDLYETHYIPITIGELQEGVKPEPVLESTINTVNDGVIRSNYRIISTRAVILDGVGEEIWSNRAFTAIHCFDPEKQDTVARSTVREVDLSVHGREYPTGGVSYVVEVLLGNGQTLKTEPMHI